MAALDLQATFENQTAANSSALAALTLGLTHTFGEAKVGNAAFVRCHAAAVAKPSGHWRVTHGRDPVVHLPHGKAVAVLSTTTTARGEAGEVVEVVEAAAVGDEPATAATDGRAGSDDEEDDSSWHHTFPEVFYDGPGRNATAWHVANFSHPPCADANASRARCADRYAASSPSPLSAAFFEDFGRWHCYYGGMSAAQVSSSTLGKLACGSLGD